jgi:hypothetical protein
VRTISTPKSAISTTRCAARTSSITHQDADERFVGLDTPRFDVEVLRVVGADRRCRRARALRARRDVESRGCRSPMSACRSRPTRGT